MAADPVAAPPPAVDLTAVIVAVTRDAPRVLVVSAAGPAGDADMPSSVSESVRTTGDLRPGGVASTGARPSVEGFPTGPLLPGLDSTLARALRRWVRDATGLELGYVEQLYTFGDRFRDPAETRGGSRRIAIAYLALVREQRAAQRMAARWVDIYGYLPWEDWRSGRPAVVTDTIEPALEAWIDAAADPSERAARVERTDIAFGRGGARWDVDRVLERYELLYELCMVDEATVDRFYRGSDPPDRPRARAGEPLVMDHRRILATALTRLRGKIKYRPLIFDLLAPTFTLTQLQHVVESLAGGRLHQANFRRLISTQGLVESTGQWDHGTGGRPAEVFRFRRDAMREHLASGIGLPGIRRATRVEDPPD